MFFLFCYFIRFSFWVDFQFSVVVLSFSSFLTLELEFTMQFSDDDDDDDDV